MKTALVLFAEGSEELEAVTVVNILRRHGLDPGLTLRQLGGVQRRIREVATVMNRLRRLGRHLPLDLSDSQVHRLLDL